MPANRVQIEAMGQRPCRHAEIFLFLGEYRPMAEKRKKTISKGTAKPRKAAVQGTSSGLPWSLLLPVLAVTFILFIPGLKNGFTNWDDVLYVTQNQLLKSMDAEGLKAIFTTPVVSNYHPLTILSLALNYQVSALDPLSYHLTSMVLHVINTGLVFWFIWLLSSGNRWISAFVALVFGIHPMHVESVAWVSERKDLLYTLFYLAAMIVYIRYIKTKQIKYLMWVTLLGVLSLLSKPAAIVLPLSLLALDYYMKRNWSWAWVTEKLPLLLASGIFAYVTMAIQAKRAVASVELYGIGERICFAGYGLIWYLVKAIVPYPLSALHPFPEHLQVWHYGATALAVAGLVFLALKVRNRNYLFGFGFYIINLVLVLQLVSIGNAVVAERYSYVPYIGLFFMLAMEIHAGFKGVLFKYKNVIAGLAAVWLVTLAVITWQRIPVWNNSQSLWENVLKQYPDSKRAWTNKGLDLYDQQKWPEVIEHLTKALELDPEYSDALEWRSRAYLENREPEKAMQDAIALQKRFPDKEAALFLMARCQDATDQTDAAMVSYNRLISMFPGKSEYFNNRGVIYFNKLQNFPEAKKDFEEAIRIQPDNGSYYLNLSRCHYMENDIDGARVNAVKAIQRGVTIDDQYQKLIGID